MIWRKSEKIDGRKRKIFICNFEGCEFKVEARFDRRASIFLSHVCAHMKQNDEIISENIKNAFNKFKEELLKLKYFQKSNKMNY